MQRALERGDPVGEPAQPAAGGRVGAADAVVEHLDLELVADHVHADGGRDARAYLPTL